MKRVYVAGKLNDNAVDYIKNFNRMVKEAEAIRKMGFAVFVPCLDFLMGAIFGYWEYRDYFENSQEWLKVADAVYVCPSWESSKGTKKEIELARKFNIPVFFDKKDLISWVCGE